uniref:T-cell immunoglobulin and mucin domain-containing protein 4-like n=1 Tax=Myxine glutinosa TaxID=7769 RepID=UPI00358EDF81
MHIHFSTVQRIFLSGFSWLYLLPFTLALVQVNVEIGGDVTLPCSQPSSQNHLMPFELVTWSCDNKTVFIKRRSGKVWAQHKRLRMVDPQDDASLMILGASREDAGHYECLAEVEGDSQTLKVEVQLKILPQKNTTPANIALSAVPQKPISPLSTVPQKSIGLSSGSSSTRRAPYIVLAVTFSITFAIALVLIVLLMLWKHHKRSHLSNPYTNGGNEANGYTTGQQELSSVHYVVMSTVEPPSMNSIYEKMLRENVSSEK